MLLFNKNRGRPRLFLLGSAAGLMAFLVSVWFCGNVSARIGDVRLYYWPSDAYKNNQNTYWSPEDAVKALVGALHANDDKKLLAVLGIRGKNSSSRAKKLIKKPLARVLSKLIRKRTG